VIGWAQLSAALAQIEEARPALLILAAPSQEALERSLNKRMFCSSRICVVLGEPLQKAGLFAALEENPKG